DVCYLNPLNEDLGNRKNSSILDLASSDEEKNGIIGVACVLAFIRGCRPNIYDLSKNLKLSSEELEIPFRRLLSNGIFSSRMNTRNDEVLKGEANAPDSTRRAWGHIAGLASGLTGLRES